MTDKDKQLRENITKAYRDKLLQEAKQNREIAEAAKKDRRHNIDAKKKEKSKEYWYGGNNKKGVMAIADELLEAGLRGYENPGTIMFESLKLEQALFKALFYDMHNLILKNLGRGVHNLYDWVKYKVEKGDIAKEKPEFELAFDIKMTDDNKLDVDSLTFFDIQKGESLTLEAEDKKPFVAGVCAWLKLHNYEVDPENPGKFVSREGETLTKDQFERLRDDKDSGQNLEDFLSGRFDMSLAQSASPSP